MTAPDKQTEQRGSATRTDEANEFAEAARERRGWLFREFWDFLKHNKKWWLGPIVVMLLLVAVLVILSGTAAAPFIYTLF
jgi:hypothetical protein